MFHRQLHFYKHDGNERIPCCLICALHWVVSQWLQPKWSLGCLDVLLSFLANALSIVLLLRLINKQIISGPLCSISGEFHRKRIMLPRFPFCLLLYLFPSSLHSCLLWLFLSLLPFFLPFFHLLFLLILPSFPPFLSLFFFHLCSLFTSLFHTCSPSFWNSNLFPIVFHHIICVPCNPLY